MSENKLKIIISGAGIGGLSVAIALRSLPFVDVELYERASELKEIGASIALSPNGLRSLEKLGVHNALDEDIAFRGPSGIPMIYRHWKTNQVVRADHYTNIPPRRHQSARFHRGHLHGALLQHVPLDIIHLNKKVISADTSAGKVTLRFADGSSVDGDVLIGADGIHSTVRKSFVPNHQLKNTGKIFIRSTFDASLVEHIENLPADSIHWWGPAENFFASRLGRNQYTTVGSFDAPEMFSNHETWDEPANVNIFREKFKTWNPVVKALVDATPHVRVYSNYAGEPLSTWVFGSPARVTLVGDAAHTHGGAFAAGGSLAIDDAHALLLAFRHTFSSSRTETSYLDVSGKHDVNAAIEKALKLYDRIRRPHTERLLKIVLDGISDSDQIQRGPERTSNSPNDVNSEDAVTRRIKNKPDVTWLSEHDVEKAFQDLVDGADAVSARGILEQPRVSRI